MISKSDYVIVRFLGTSKLSSNIKTVFISIILHLNYLFNFGLYDAKSLRNDSVFILKVKIIDLFKKIGSTSSKVFIFFDGIDQLLESDYNVYWLIYQDIPKNIKLVYSVLSSNELYIKIRNKINKYKPQNDSCIEVKELKLDDSIKMFDQHLKNKYRKLQSKQYEAV